MATHFSSHKYIAPPIWHPFFTKKKKMAQPFQPPHQIQPPNLPKLKWDAKGIRSIEKRALQMALHHCTDIALFWPNVNNHDHFLGMAQIILAKSLDMLLY